MPLSAGERGFDAARDAGMCVHGNFPSSCARCSEGGKAAAESAQSGAFADRLLPPKLESRTEKLREHRDRPAILVRERVIQDDENAAELMAAYTDGKASFDRLRDEYGVRVVSMEQLGGKNEDGKDAIFTIVDRIEGENLESIGEFPPEAQAELESLYGNAAEYYRDAQRDNEKYWSDFSNAQFVYGNKVGEQDKHFYLVDVEAHFHRPGENELFPVTWPILQVSRGLVDAEKKFPSGVRLDDARRKLTAVIEEMRAGGHDPVLAQAMDALAGGEWER